MHCIKKAGATSVILDIAILDNALFADTETQGGLTGLVFNTASLTCYYHRDTAAAAVAVTLVTMTVGTFTSSGFKEIDATNMPGKYQLCLPDAAFASGAKSVSVTLKGATGMVQRDIHIQLTSLDVDDAVRAGLTALPNAAAAASGGLPTVDAVNSVKVQVPVKRNTALADFPFVMSDSSGNPLTGLTVAAARSIDSAAFAACTNTPATERSNGSYFIDLSAADLNGICVILRFSATGARDLFVSLLTNP